MKRRIIIWILIVLPIISIGQTTIDITFLDPKAKTLNVATYGESIPDYSEFKLDNNKAVFTIYNHIDSIEFEIQDYIPISISGFKNIKMDTVRIEIKETFHYIPYDTIIYSSSHKKKFSKKFKTENKTIIENNSLKLDSFPDSIEVRINCKEHEGYISKEIYFGVIMADGENMSSQEITKGVEVKYRIKINGT